MQVCIHRGAKEIGGSCVEVTSGGKRLIIDLGLPLDAEQNNNKYLPNIPGLDGSDDSLLAILISHPHMDHFGLLGHISCTIPVIMGADARRIITKASPFLPGNWPIPTEGPALISGLSLMLGPFTITPYLIDHSGYDAYSLLIEADGKRLFYSGDFRMHGRKAKLTEKLLANPPKSIDVLLMEGSSLGRLEEKGSFPSESEIEQKLLDAFTKAKGIVLVHTSSQNIDRLVSIFRACKKSGKTLVIDLYPAIILEATGNKNLPQSHWPEIALYIPQSQRVQIKTNAWFDLLKKHSHNRIFIEDLRDIAPLSVLLFRPLHMRDLDKAECIVDAIYIYSQWEGYWERDSNAYLREWIGTHSIPKLSIHTSGHASPSDLIRFAEALIPAKTVPIHTFMPDLYTTLFQNVQPHADGEYWEV